MLFRSAYKVSIPDEMLNVLVPQFTVQPIVENAIKYALEEAPDKCHVNVLGYIENETAVVVVEDDGPGIDPNILQKLEAQEATPKGHGIGLLNIQKRIQLLFSEDYGLRVFCKDGITQIQICVPYQREESAE